MPNTAIDDFLTQAFEGGDDLSPEQAAQLLELSGNPGDTGAPVVPENSSVPGAATAQTEGTKTEPPAAPAAAPDEASLGADNAVILAKDGKHTISYEKLVQAREGERAAREQLAQLQAQAEEANRKLAELEALAKARADAGQAPTQTDNQIAAAQAAIDQGVDPGIFGDFSEAALAKGIATLVADQVKAQVTARMAEIDTKLQPIEQKAVKDATTAHYEAIYKAHADADSIAESQEFAAWKAAQPSVVRVALDNALQHGSASDVIEVFTAFKNANPGQAEPPAAGAGQQQQSPAEAAKAAIAKAAAPVPASLSDIPGGRVAGTNLAEAMDGMDSHELLGAMQNMSREQIEAYLNSQI